MNLQRDPAGADLRVEGSLEEQYVDDHGDQGGFHHHVPGVLVDQVEPPLPVHAGGVPYVLPRRLKNAYHGCPSASFYAPRAIFLLLSDV